MIPWTTTELRWRDELMDAILPAPGRGLPALAELDLRSFWARFDEAAPLRRRWCPRAPA